MASPEDSEAACPTYSKVIAAFETRPLLACVAIVDSVAPTSHVRLASVQVLAATTLAKVESILPEKTMAVSRTMTTPSHTTGTSNNPPVSSIWTMVPEEHPCMTTTLEHFESHKTPTSANSPSGHSTAPAV
jgi:hypothetical protein